MNIAAFDVTLRHFATFDSDIEALEDLDPLFANERVRTLCGYGDDSPEADQLIFFELKEGVTFQKHVDYTVNRY